MAEKELNPWNWFAEKVLPSLFVALSIAVVGAAVSTHETVKDLSNDVRVQSAEMMQLKAQVQQIRTDTVTRNELLETVKRVEQQLEIITLRSRLKEK